MRLAHRTAHDGEILGENINQPSVHFAPAGHHAIGEWMRFFHPQPAGPVGDKHANFLEGAGINQLLNPFAGGQLVLGVLGGNALFTAAGITKVPVTRLLPPFLAGKFISDATMVMAGRYAAGSVRDMLHGVLGWKSLLTSAVTLVVTGAFMFVDWHALLATKTLRFNFSVWK